MQTRRLQKNKWVDPLTHISVQYHNDISAVSLHLHDYFELEIVLSGQGEQNLNGSVYPIELGTVYLLTPIDFHSITSKEGVSVCNVAFTENVISPALQMDFMNRRGDLIFSSEKEAALLTMLVKKLEEECRNSDALAVQARRHILELLLISVARGVGQGGSALYSSSVQASMQYLFQHFREEVTLKEIAARSGYTANYFSYLFHQRSGERFVDFLTKLRLNYAKMLLLSTGASMAQIAQSSGFSSQSNFFRVFRKEMGLSPLEYRRRAKL